MDENTTTSTPPADNQAQTTTTTPAPFAMPTSKDIDDLVANCPANRLAELYGVGRQLCAQVDLRWRSRK